MSTSIVNDWETRQWRSTHLGDEQRTQQAICLARKWQGNRQCAEYIAGAVLLIQDGSRQDFKLRQTQCYLDIAQRISLAAA